MSTMIRTSRARQITEAQAFLAEEAHLPSTTVLISLVMALDAASLVASLLAH